MTNTIRLSVVNAMIARLETLTVANGFTHEVLSVQMPSASGFAISELPTIGIAYGERKQLEAGKFTCFLDIDIEVYADSQVMADEIAADVEQVIMERAPDLTAFGGTQRITSVNPFLVPDGEQDLEAGVVIQVEFIYRHPVGNPRKAV